MASSTNKAKSFFEQRKNAAKTATIVEAAAATEEKIETKETKTAKSQGIDRLLADPKENKVTNEIIIQKKALGEKISNSAVPVPPDIKNFIETINCNNKINVNLPIEIDNKLQIALLRIKSKYGLNNRQMNKTVLLSYIIDKILREDEFFGI
jgi:hypothetical protein